MSKQIWAVPPTEVLTGVCSSCVYMGFLQMLRYPQMVMQILLYLDPLQLWLRDIQGRFRRRVYRFSSLIRIPEKLFQTRELAVALNLFGSYPKFNQLIFLWSSFLFKFYKHSMTYSWDFSDLSREGIDCFITTSRLSWMKNVISSVLTWCLNRQ